MADSRTNSQTFDEKRPFYWTAPLDLCGTCAPSGWYQWTPGGLIFLGESILEREAGDV